VTKQLFCQAQTSTGLLDENRVAHGIGWFYMVTKCVIQLSIGCH